VQDIPNSTPKHADTMQALRAFSRSAVAGSAFLRPSIAVHAAGSNPCIARAWGAALAQPSVLQSPLLARLCGPGAGASVRGMAYVTRKKRAPKRTFFKLKTHAGIKKRFTPTKKGLLKFKRSRLQHGLRFRSRRKNRRKAGTSYLRPDEGNNSYFRYVKAIPNMSPAHRRRSGLNGYDKMVLRELDILEARLKGEPSPLDTPVTTNCS
jgi:ribosomal protein L35